MGNSGGGNVSGGVASGREREEIVPVDRSRRLDCGSIFDGRRGAVWMPACS